MKRTFLSLLVLCAVSMASAQTKQLFDDGWQFSLGAKESIGRNS